MAKFKFSLLKMQHYIYNVEKRLGQDACHVSRWESVHLRRAGDWVRWGKQEQVRTRNKADV